MVKNKMAPLFWASIALTILMILSNLFHFTVISWWAVFYPFLVYMTFLATIFILSTKLPELIVKTQIAKSNVNLDKKTLKSSKSKESK